MLHSAEWKMAVRTDWEIEDILICAKGKTKRQLIQTSQQHSRTQTSNPGRFIPGKENRYPLNMKLHWSPELSGLMKRRSSLGLSRLQARIIRPVAYSVYLLNYAGSSKLKVQFVSRATDGGWNTLTPNRAQCRTFVNTIKGIQFLIHWG